MKVIHSHRLRPNADLPLTRLPKTAKPPRLGDPGEHDHHERPDRHRTEPSFSRSRRPCRRPSGIVAHTHPLVVGVDTPHAAEQRQRAEECDIIAADLRLKAKDG